MLICTNLGRLGRAEVGRIGEILRACRKERFLDRCGGARAGLSIFGPTEMVAQIRLFPPLFPPCFPSGAKELRVAGLPGQLRVEESTRP